MRVCCHWFGQDRARYRATITRETKKKLEAVRQQRNGGAVAAQTWEAFSQKMGARDLMWDWVKAGF